MKRRISYILLFLFICSGGNLSWAWQQKVDYRIAVQLDTKENTLQGKEALIYTNQSPDTLRWVWFHLYPNAYRDNRTLFAQE